MRIETLDLEFQGVPRTVAAFLVIGDRDPVLVETGPASTLPKLGERLAEHGLRPADVRHVLVTHIHLDHAGAAGWWAQQGATVYVHGVGAPHLVDPSRLLTSAKRIYGDAMDRLWGQMVPAPEERVVAVGDGDEITIGDLTFTALDTPGHASHHHVYRLGNVAFTGDAAAIRIPDYDWIDLPAPPPEFDLEVWKATLDRLRSQELEAIYRTHFGRSETVAEDLDVLEQRLDESANLIRGMIEQEMARPAMLEGYEWWLDQRLAGAGVDDEAARAYEIANPRAMSVDGIARYWRKRTG